MKKKTAMKMKKAAPAKMGHKKSPAKKKKLTDLSGDGKITKKDVLIGRGVIPATKMKKAAMKLKKEEGAAMKMKKAAMKLKKEETAAMKMKKAAMKLKKDSAMMMKKAGMKMKSAMKMKAAMKLMKKK